MFDDSMMQLPVQSLVKHRLGIALHGLFNQAWQQPQAVDEV